MQFLIVGVFPAKAGLSQRIYGLLMCSLRKRG